MPYLTMKTATLSGQEMLDRGITDVLIHDVGSGSYLYTTSGPTGGVAAYRIGADGALTFIDFAHFRADWSASVMPELAIVGGRLVVAAGAGTEVQSFAVGWDGRLTATTTMTGLADPSADIAAVEQALDDMLFAANLDTGGVDGYRVGGDGALSRAMSAQDTDATYAKVVTMIETLSIGGQDYVIAACAEECGVTAFQLTGNGLIATGRLGADQGIGMMTPTAMASVVLDGRAVVVVGSSPTDGVGRSGAITVMEIAPDGSLRATDHVTDTALTRFGQVSNLHLIEADGRVHIAAGGADEGLTLFTLLPNGRLQLVDTIIDTFANALDNITGLEGLYSDDTLQLFVASERAAGVTQISVDLSAQGQAVDSVDGFGRRVGTSGDDIILGRQGDDVILGMAGDDMIEDGGGADTLTGGDGRDIFILRNDGVRDVITDFDPSRDRLDLSDWAFLYDAANLAVTPTAAGAIVTWRGEYLELQTGSGTSLSQAQVVQAIVQAPNRAPSLAEIGQTTQDQLLEGSQTQDMVDGGSGSDTIYGHDGDDVLRGGDDPDKLWGGSGNDYLEGGENRDTLWGEAGNDVLSGGSDFDTLYGGDGNDYLYGGWHADVILGEAGRDHLFGGLGNDNLQGGVDDDHLFGEYGDDWLFGGDGQDSMWGGHDHDRMAGEAGDDRLYGDWGFDFLDGGEGNDLLSGGDQADNLFGGAGDDAMFGGQGLDRLFGGLGNDIMFGGTGNDGMFGEYGNNTLFGESGTDRFFAGQGNDLIFGGDDNDTVYAGAGFDTIDGGRGDDELWGKFNADVFTFQDGHGNDTIADFQATNIFEKINFSAVAAINDLDDVVGPGGAATQAGRNVYIDTGGGDSIWLLNVDLADLDETDFLF